MVAASLSKPPLPLPCPHCGHELPPDARTCPQCGVDLVLLSLLAERAYLEGLPEAAPISGPPTALVPRIGEYLLDQGLINEEQLRAALEQQKVSTARGQHRLLGQTLMDMGAVDRETLDRAITRQIIELHAALQEVNRSLERRVNERTAELRRALERLTEINQVKANLISNVSHELRTPLAHIKGYIELIGEHQLGPLTAEQENALGVVQRATERLGRLIEDLIEFSTASRQGITLNLATVDPAVLVDQVLARSKEKADKAGVGLERQLGESLPTLMADPDRLGWVLFQLVDNGVKFTPSGGHVVVRVQREARGVRLEVEDNGIGIPVERSREIFEPFHQLDGSPTRRYGGTGLGLALAKLILDAHGAELTFESQVGGGTVFRFVLPDRSSTA
ncbi:MAG TPA: ATP-binding protein [Anaerolineales bacterium]|nr:ATP-binding protein [Anaerolineales bacterium]